jgi:hypothetical protein
MRCSFFASSRTISAPQALLAAGQADRVAIMMIALLMR